MVGVLGDDGRNYDSNDSAFEEEGTFDRDDEESDCEEEINVMGPANEDIPGPAAVDPYNGPHGLRSGIANSFTTADKYYMGRDGLLFGILLRISMEPRRMGGYVSYFQDDTILNLGQGYHVVLHGYTSWSTKVMALDHFCQICSASCPEFGDSTETGDTSNWGVGRG
eukprot:7856037-Ditylum_brightwellii.AAC.1